ncbi:MAG TPA: aminoglycoside phosphotransferase family protein [Anaerolineaceae bacterium]|nr:aminoglycoside phosphotransferase family protein [Anaerolineaceae bacterium]HPN51014.1 aminoglycoside phosphotransferase family protein [Anaerolineaceae bacterium]
MENRQQHRLEVLGFLKKHFPGKVGELSLPEGSGQETYFARCGQSHYFVKLGVDTARYAAISDLGVTPPLLAAGVLEDGTSIMVQPRLDGRHPTRKDYRDHLDAFADAIWRVHHSIAVRQALPKVDSELYSEAGLRGVMRLRKKWAGLRERVLDQAGFVDEGLDRLEKTVSGFEGEGLAASHNDICNANWLLTTDGRLVLLDLEMMALDDPALDVGATLWWYIPPALRERFLMAAGYPTDEAFRERMRTRMAMHCLSIILPREQSFDRFDPAGFAEALVDFRAALAGEENPQGYD